MEGDCVGDRAFYWNVSKNWFTNTDRNNNNQPFILSMSRQILDQNHMGMNKAIAHHWTLATWHCCRKVKQWTKVFNCLTKALTSKTEQNQWLISLDVSEMTALSCSCCPRPLFVREAVRVIAAPSSWESES